MWRSEDEMLDLVRARAGHLRRRRLIVAGLASTAVAAAVVAVAVTLSPGGGAHVSRVDVSGGQAPSASPLPTTIDGAGAPGGQGIQQLTPVGADVVWASTNPATTTTTAEPFPQVVRSSDGGRTWQVVTPPSLETAQRSISDADFLDATHAWVAYGRLSGGPQTLAATSDGGQHWTTVGRLPSAYCRTLQFVDAADGWCVEVGAAMGEDQVDVYQTTDGGRTWPLISHSATATAPGTPGSAGSLPLGCDKTVTFLNTTEGWAGLFCAAGVSPLYETTDGGRTWVQRRVDSPRPPTAPPTSTQPLGPRCRN